MSTKITLMEKSHSSCTESTADREGLQNSDAVTAQGSDQGCNNVSGWEKVKGYRRTTGIMVE